MCVCVFRGCKLVSKICVLKVQLVYMGVLIFVTNIFGFFGTNSRFTGRLAKLLSKSCGSVDRRVADRGVNFGLRVAAQRERNITEFKRPCRI